MSAGRAYIGTCWTCDEELHTGDVGGIVYDAGYEPVCEPCARRNAWALSDPIGTLIRTGLSSPWCTYTTIPLTSQTKE